MADDSGSALKRQLYFQQILLEARSRWLRPNEICEIIHNCKPCDLAPIPPNKPPGGSLFLFDRKKLRYFRKDSHCWRKKKDGSTVREAHEKLKSLSADVLHCYYAHGEDNENFQRRSYRMLDKQLEHIVLVHYRDVKEDSRPSVSSTVDTQGAQITSDVSSTHLSSAFTFHASNTSSPSANLNRRTPSTGFVDTDSGDDFGRASLADSISCSGFQIASLPRNDNMNNNAAGCSGSISRPYESSLADTMSLNRVFDPFLANQVASQNPILSEDQQIHCGSSQPPGSFGEARFSHHMASSTSSSLNREFVDLQQHNISFERPNLPDVLTRRHENYMLDTFGVIKDGVDGGPNGLPDAYSQSFMQDGRTLLQIKEVNSQNSHSPFEDNRPQDDSAYKFYKEPQFKFNGSALVNNTSINQPREHNIEGSFSLKTAPECVARNDEFGELKRLDSFGRWMNKEIGKDCDDSLMASDSCNYWRALGTQTGEKEVSSLSHHMQLDIDSLGPSLSQDQLYSIIDFSPDWAYSDIETKVLISGTFLSCTEPASRKWCCMFGENEVSAEVLTTNAIRCQAPPHAPGRVPFYITCSNRLACSEVREFEYREVPLALKSEPEEEINLQVQFAKMLSLGVYRKRLVCSVENCHKCKLKGRLSSLLSDNEKEWERIEKVSKAFRGYHMNNSDTLLQKLFKGMLYEWLVSKSHEEGKGPNVLDEEGQGIIHLAAALGYEWGMRPIVAAGVHPSLRDRHGRTALHWAAYFGREGTVAALVRLGVDPAALEDPTLKFPEGQTAADLASSKGYKGIAGYLAEAALTSHLSSLTLKESVMDTVSANLDAEKAIEIVREQAIVPLDGDKGAQVTLRGSLAAVRNSALAAARIQFAFRVHSFRQRQLTEGSRENNAIADDALVFSSLTRAGHFTDFLHTSAAKIQHKYRGWKARKDFLKIRDQIVKIQAHVRGHQVRKQNYKKIVRAVSILEKAVLRWRRKRTGLRGIRYEETGAVEQTDEYEFLHVGRKQKATLVQKTLARVTSMTRSPEARDQYMRLVASSHKSKLEDGSNSSFTEDQVAAGEEKADAAQILD